MLEKSKVCSTSELTIDDAPSGMVPSVWSWAKIVKLPLALKRTLTVAVPLLSAKGDGSVALASDARIWIVLPTVGTRFQVASQARIVTLNGIPAVCARGVPVRPVDVPGAGLSPGSRTWSRVYGPASTGVAAMTAINPATIAIRVTCARVCT
jgi:hypothetical protein